MAQVLHPLMSATVIAAYTGNTHIFERHSVCEHTPQSWRKYARDKLLAPVVVDELQRRPDVQKRVNWRDVVVLLADPQMEKESTEVLVAINKEIVSSINSRISSPPFRIPKEVSLSAVETLKIFEEMQYEPREAAGSPILRGPEVSRKIVSDLLGQFPGRQTDPVGYWGKSLLSLVMESLQSAVNSLVPKVAAQMEAIIRSAVPG